MSTNYEVEFLDGTTTALLADYHEVMPGGVVHFYLDNRCHMSIGTAGLKFYFPMED